MTITLTPFCLRSRRHARRLLGASILLVALTVQASPWDDISTGLFNEAHTAFINASDEAAPADRRILRYGEAVSLLNAQPRTQSNIDQAYGILEEVRNAGAGDDLALEARYLQGRIEQIQRSTPSPSKAEAIYLELIAQTPDHPVAQRALVKLAIIRLYDRIDSAERRQRYDWFTREAARLTDDGARVQLHLLLAEYARRLEYGNEQELAHMLAAYKAGVTKRRLLVEVLVRIGDLSRLTGRNDMARDFYTRFLEQFPRTDRRSTVEGYLAALPPSK